MVGEAAGLEGSVAAYGLLVLLVASTRSFSSRVTAGEARTVAAWPNQPFATVDCRSARHRCGQGGAATVPRSASSGANGLVRAAIEPRGCLRSCSTCARQRRRPARRPRRPSLGQPRDAPGICRACSLFRAMGAQAGTSARAGGGARLWRPDSQSTATAARALGLEEKLPRGCRAGNVSCNDERLPEGGDDPRLRRGITPRRTAGEHHLRRARQLCRRSRSRVWRYQHDATRPGTCSSSSCRSGR